MIGPLERWEHEARKLNRDALLSMVIIFLKFYVHSDETRLLEIADARRQGELTAFMRQLKERQSDPLKADERYYAKKLAAIRKRRKAAR